MKIAVVMFAFVLLLAKQSLAESCRTCKGVNCAARNVPEKLCEEYLPSLPFESQLIFNEVDDNAQYGCLQLEYYVDTSVQQVQQCILSSDLHSYCGMIEAAVKVKSCSIEKTLEERVGRSLEAQGKLSLREGENDEASEDDEVTDEPDTESTTASADLSKVLSFSAVVGAFSILLI